MLSARSRRAEVSARARRSAAAWALPRPSARLAKTTVSQSQTTTDQAKTLPEVTASAVESPAPTSTTNITGEWTMLRGSS
jgi:hypothetical protein